MIPLPARPLILASLFLLASAAGCLAPESGSSAKIDTVFAPDWQAGYTWKYTASETYKDAGPAYSGDADTSYSSYGETSTVTYSVFNTTLDFEGTPAYYVRVEGADSYAPGMAPLLVYAQDSLEVIAWDRENHYGYDGPVAMPMPPMPMMEMDYGYPGYYGDDIECEYVPRVNEVDDDSRMPAIDFPLTSGKTWSGRWTMDYYMSLDYEGRVVGEEKVTIGDRTYDTVHAAFQLTSPQVDMMVPMAVPASDGPAGTPPYETRAPEFSSHQMSARMDFWYAEDVQNLVKSTLVVDMPGPYASQMESTTELRSFDLTAAPEEPAPGKAPPPPEPIDIEIVSDTMFPVNVVNGTVPASFWIQPTSSGHSDMEGQVQVGTGPSEADVYDHDAFTLVWTVSSYGNWEGGIVDDVIEEEIGPGSYWLNANLVSKKCGYPLGGQAHAQVSTFWEKAFDVAGSPAVGTNTQDVASFDIFQMAMNPARMTWTVDPQVPLREDDAVPRLLDPDGRVVYGTVTGAPNEAFFSPYPAGEWALEWETRDVALGDDATVVVHVDYGMDPYYCCYY